MNKILSLGKNVTLDLTGKVGKYSGDDTPVDPDSLPYFRNFTSMYSINSLKPIILGIQTMSAIESTYLGTFLWSDSLESINSIVLNYNFFKNDKKPLKNISKLFSIDKIDISGPNGAIDNFGLHIELSNSKIPSCYISTALSEYTYKNHPNSDPMPWERLSAEDTEVEQYLALSSSFPEDAKLISLTMNYSNKNLDLVLYSKNKFEDNGLSKIIKPREETKSIKQINVQVINDIDQYFRNR